MTRKQWKRISQHLKLYKRTIERYKEGYLFSYSYR